MFNFMTTIYCKSIVSLSNLIYYEGETGGGGLVQVTGGLTNATDEANNVVNVLGIVALIVAGGFMVFNKEKGVKMAMGVIMGMVVAYLAYNGFIATFLEGVLGKGN